MAELMSLANRIMVNPTYQWGALIVAGSLMVVFLFLRSLKLALLFAVIFSLAFFLWIKGPASDRKIDSLQKQYAPFFKINDSDETKTK
jgi:hypothetical protein